MAELVRAYGIAKCDGSDTRLRKWIAAFGAISAWSITPEQLEAAGQAMLEHGYKPAAVNRDLSALGSAFRWAKAKRLSPRGFKSPTVSVRRHEEAIRRVHVERQQIDDLRARALAFRDRRFGVFVSLLVDTGARKSELLERRWSDVDLGRREILAPTTKNGTPRVLFYQAETAELMGRAYPRRDPAKLLFEGRVPDQPMEFRKACPGPDVAAEGVLVYPVTSDAVDRTYTIQGHKLRVRTLDLAQEWPRIERDLLALI